MQNVRKRTRRPVRRGWLLLAAACLLGAVWGLYALTGAPQPEAPPAEIHRHGGALTDYRTEDVRSISIALRNGSSFTALQREAGVLTLEEDATYRLEGVTQGLLNALCSVRYDDVLTDDPAVYADRLEEFGLAQPRIVATVTYLGGASCTLRVGDAWAIDNGAYYYMTVDGDDRLFSLDRGTVENLLVHRDDLHEVVQPVLHKARMDRISLTRGEDAAVWELQGDIGSDARDRWLLVSPLRYQADGESMVGLQDNLVNLRLGRYVGEATPENLTACGFDAPRLVIGVHQARGSIGTVNAEGVYGVTDWPEQDFTLTVGDAKNDVLDYVLVDGRIYTSNHFSLNVFLSQNPADTLSRYPVQTALGNLSRLTVESGGSARVYTVTRTEQVAENNELVTDASGNVVYDLTCDVDGRPLNYATFEAAYQQLLTVTVSGRLPEGWTPTHEPHTVFTFEDVLGRVHTVALSRFDALHDAVTVDGCTVFYLIGGGMTFDVE